MQREKRPRNDTKIHEENGSLFRVIGGSVFVLEFGPSADNIIDPVHCNSYNPQPNEVFAAQFGEVRTVSVSVRLRIYSQWATAATDNRGCRHHSAGNYAD